MLGHKKSKVCIIGLLCWILIAVSVDRDDAVGVLINHRALGVHTEGTNLVAVLLCAVNDLALVKLVRKMREHSCGKLHSNSDIHAVGLCGNVKTLAYLFHPLASYSAYRNDTLFAGIGCFPTLDRISAGDYLNGINVSVKEELDLVLQVVVKIFKNYIVDICSEMTHRSIKKMKVILNAKGLETGACGAVKLTSLAAIAHIYLIHVVHQIKRVLFADVFVQSSAEIVGDVVFTVGECSRTAKAAHNRTALTADTGLDLFSVNRATALVESVSRLEHRNLQLGSSLHKLVCGKDTARACADNYNIVIHMLPL